MDFKKLRLPAMVFFLAGAVAPALLSRTSNAKPAPPAAAVTAANRAMAASVNPNTIVLSQTAWTPLGPQPAVPLPGDPHMGYPVVSGQVNALAYDPRDTTDQTIYLGSVNGGLWVTTDGGQSWKALTDIQPSLAVASIALDPSTNPSTIYIGTGKLDRYGYPSTGAGVLKSTDGGKTWTQDQTFAQIISANPSDAWPYIGSLAVAPNNNQILLAAVESYNPSSLPGGIWRSTDGGSTWSVALKEAANTNAGSDIPAGTSVVFDPAVPDQAFAVLGDAGANAANGVYESSDDGATWTLLKSLTNFGHAKLALSPPTSTASGVLVVSIADSSSASINLLGVYSAPIATGGAVGTFTQMTAVPDFCGNASTYQSQFFGCAVDMAVGVSPDNPRLVYLGGSNLYGGDSLIVSSDGGSTWSPDLYAGNGACTSKTSSGQCINANGQLQTGTRAIAFSPDAKMLAVGNAGGVWTTSNVGASANVTWNDLNASLAITQFSAGIAIFPDNPNLGLGGSVGAGALEYGGSPRWTAKLCASGGYTVVTPDGSTAYVACGDNGGVYSLSSSGTLKWAANGIGSCTSTAAAGCYSANPIAPIAIDVLNPSTLYFGANVPGATAVIYQSTDGGDSWQSVSPTISNGATANVTGIAVSPTNDNVVYAGSSDGSVWMTSDALDGSGSKWQSVFSLALAPAVSDIAVDPSLASIAYVSYAVPGVGAPGIYETSDSGRNWSSISGNLPGLAVNAFVVDPYVANTIYAATGKGVYVTSDDGTIWSPLATGLPNVPVTGITLDAKSRTLWAATDGRGMWALQLPQVTVPPTAIPSPASLNFSNVDVGSASAAQTVTVTNNGGSTLNFSSIVVASPFAETNDCGTSLPVGSNCSIQVTYTPSGTGSVGTSLSINGNLRLSQQVPVYGSGQDFSVSAENGSASAAAGQVAIDKIDVKPLGVDGFTDPVSLSCSGVPSETACALIPDSVTPGTGTSTVTLNITTTAPSAVVPLFGPGGPGTMTLALWAALLLVLAMLVALAGKARKRLGFAFASGALLLCLLVPVVSCGGGSHNPGTPPGTYTVTVTGKSGSLTHSATVSLTVTKPTS